MTLGIRLSTLFVSTLLLFATSVISSAEQLGKFNKEGISFEGMLTSVDADAKRGVINLGVKQNVRPGDKFTIIRSGGKLVDRKSKRVIGVKEVLVGEIEVVVTSNDYSDVIFKRGERKAKEGDLIRGRVAPLKNIKIIPAGLRMVKLFWTFDPQPDISGFVVYRSEKPTEGYKELSKLSGAKTIEFLDKHSSTFPMEDSKRYYYQIATVNIHGNFSLRSEPVTVTTQPAPIPPIKFRGAGASRSTILQWDMHPLADVSGYKIYKLAADSKKWNLIKEIKSRKTIEFRDNGENGTLSSPTLTELTTYRYIISSVSIYGAEGIRSKSISVTTKPKPTPPTNFFATGWQARKIPLKWSQHKDPEVVGYIIYRSLNEKGPYQEVVEIKGRNKTSYIDGAANDLFGKDGKGTLKDFSNYYYKISAFNKVASRSMFSPPVSATTKAAPLAPEGLVATSNLPRNIPLSWRANPEIDIKKYEIYRSDRYSGDYTKIGTTDAKQIKFTDQKLANGAQYYYKIKVIDKYSIESNFSKPIRGQTKPAPKKVSGLSHTFDKQGKPIIVWDKNPEVDVKHYMIYQRTLFGWKLIAKMNRTNYVIKDMKRGEKRDFAVSAMLPAEIEGDKSEPITVDLR
ncbi:MAG: fibronectin type III domain-containing protein [Nitrospinota bacterium]